MQDPDQNVNADFRGGMNHFKEFIRTAGHAVADAFDEQLFPTMQPDPSKNAKRNSRLDIEALHYITGETCLSTMVLARISFDRAQVCSPFMTNTYDLATGEKIALTDLFDENSEAWELMAQRVDSHLNSLFELDDRQPEAVAALCTREALENAAMAKRKKK